MTISEISENAVPTTGAKSRIPLAQAEPIAREALALLAPACHRIEIAGSIRRRRPDVADVELVAVPRLEPILDLFGEQRGERDALHALCRQLLLDGVLSHRPDKNGVQSFGSKSKRVVYHGQAGTLPLDLFAVTDGAQWGAIFTIRTGPWLFAKRLVTPRLYGGYMPMGMRESEGALWDGARLVETPEETDFFAALGVAWLPPERRTDDAQLTPLRGAR